MTIAPNHNFIYLPRLKNYLKGLIIERVWRLKNNQDAIKAKSLTFVKPYSILELAICFAALAIQDPKRLIIFFVNYH